MSPIKETLFAKVEGNSKDDVHRVGGEAYTQLPRVNFALSEVKESRREVVWLKARKGGAADSTLEQIEANESVFCICIVFGARCRGPPLRAGN